MNIIFLREQIFAISVLTKFHVTLFFKIYIYNPKLKEALTSAFFIIIGRNGITMYG